MKRAREGQSAEDVMKLFKQLSAAEQARFVRLLKGGGSGSDDMEEYLTEQRFSGGRVCPICGSIHVCRNGKRENGTQKFVCRDCGKSFSIRKNTVFSGTHKGLSTWKEYMECMAEGLTISESAERCGISEGTSFNWRHKILDSLGERQKGVTLSGIVEADETFVPVSYKGGGSVSGKGVSRKPHKRGGENHRRGLSDGLVCVPCAVDRKGNAVSRMAKLGKCSSEALDKVLGGRVSSESTLCSDDDASYRKFSKRNGNSLVQIKGGKGSVKGIYHIQHQNAYHSKLKAFLASFKGVSSKYLNNYLTWNNVVEHGGGTLREKAARILSSVTTTLFEETCLNVKFRPVLPLLVKNQS